MVGRTNEIAALEEEVRNEFRELAFKLHNQRRDVMALSKETLGQIQKIRDLQRDLNKSVFDLIQKEQTLQIKLHVRPALMKVGGRQVEELEISIKEVTIW